ncbi:DUF397 domain-containing protein [Micromonospora sp. NPDC047074]|uniref:DUF397 domain-containing protein n=1 Tax=Micromonospora sp. NPDC047074 TaxID=3154339 RepID=UPI0033D29795
MAAGQCPRDGGEVADNLPGVVGVRDSKDPHGPALTFTARAWSAFVGGVVRQG